MFNHAVTQLHRTRPPYARMVLRWSEHYTRSRISVYYTGPRPRLPATRLVVRMCTASSVVRPLCREDGFNRDSLHARGLALGGYRFHLSRLGQSTGLTCYACPFSVRSYARTPWPNGIGNYLSLTRSNHADSHIHVSMFEPDTRAAPTRREPHVSNSDHDSDMPRVRATLLTIVSIFTKVADAHCPVAHCIGIGYAICVFRQPRPAGLRMKRDKDEIATWRLDPAAPCRK